VGDSCACLDPVNKDCALYLRYNNVLLVLLDEVRASIVTGEKRVKSDVGERESRKEKKTSESRDAYLSLRRALFDSRIARSPARVLPRRSEELKPAGSTTFAEQLIRAEARDAREHSNSLNLLLEVLKAPNAQVDLRETHVAVT